MNHSHKRRIGEYDMIGLVPKRRVVMKQVIKKFDDNDFKTNCVNLYF